MGNIAKEDAKTGMILETARAFARRTDPDTGTKGTEVVELRFVARVEAFKSRRAIALGGETVLDAKIVVESIGPKMRAKRRASKHGTEGVANRLVSPFNRAILVG
jgi:hypothetical protein